MLDSLSGIYGDSLAIISYHLMFTDPAVYGPRNSFYSSPPHPTAFFDGTDEVFELDPNALFTTYTDHYFAAKSDSPTYYVEVTATATASSGDLQIRIVTADIIPVGEVIAYAAICQDSVHGIIKDFNYVCRLLYEFPLEMALPDSVLDLDTTITFSHALPIDKMRAVVFVQNMSTKKVLHSATTRFEEEE
ncbi:MAG: hypothetical protein JSW49_09755 [candidate division WOR-3 bacterium]|nr:MAG: hypothetical protein JSW49_09755 [candidate division WOR-3 bacterium]